MKTKLYIFTLAALSFGSCKFDQSQKIDLGNATAYKGVGLSSDDVTITINDSAQTRKEFAFGEKVVLGFNNVQGLKRVNGLAFPGMAMYIVQNGTDTLLANNDLLESLQEGTDLEPLLLEASFTAGLAGNVNEKYKAFIHIWDKKGEGTLDYELPFTVTPNKTLNIDASGITYSNIYLWDETEQRALVTNEVNIKNETMLLINDVKGLAEKNGLLFPKLSLELIDSKGNEVLSSPNLFADVEQTGVAEVGQIPVTITFTEGSINNPVKLNAILTDMNSDKKLIITGNLVVR